MSRTKQEKGKKEIRLTATVDVGEYEDKQPGGAKVKKRAYLTVYEDELKTLGEKAVTKTDLVAIKITKGPLKGRTIYRPIDDTSATGRHFRLLYLKKRASGVGKKRIPATYDDISAYYPTSMTTKQIFASIERLAKRPSFVITDLGTRVKTQVSSRVAVSG
jgi:hypothetical protein